MENTQIAVSLDDVTVAYLAEIDAAAQKAVEPYQLKKEAVLELFARRNKLTGNWRQGKQALGEDPGSLVRIDAAPETSA